MIKEYKGKLIEAVKASTEVLNDEDALAIIEICKRAANREIASVTEEYLAEGIKGNDEE